MKVKSLVTNSWFTKDKTYEVIMMRGIKYTEYLGLIDDLGFETRYVPKFFITLEEWREQQINKIIIKQ
jgi:hypothetical protein